MPPGQERAAPKDDEGRPAARAAIVVRAGQTARRRRVYQSAAAPRATRNPPTATVAPIGAPVNGRVPAGLTPPPPGVAGADVAGLTPPGGTVSVLPVGVDWLGVGAALLGLTPPYPGFPRSSFPAALPEPLSP